MSVYIDSGSEDYSVAAEISKVFAGEALQRDHPYEQITRDYRIPTIFEGTNEVLRLYIGLSALKIFAPMPQLLGRPAGISAWPIIRQAGRNEDEEMNQLAGFILDNGSYPWDVVL
jgi:hypothetical protein